MPSSFSITHIHLCIRFPFTVTQGSVFTNNFPSVCIVLADLLPLLSLVNTTRKVEMKALVTQSCLTLCTPVDCIFQAPLSMEFSRKEYWTGLPFPSPGGLPNSGIEPADSLPSEPPGKPKYNHMFILFLCNLQPVLLKDISRDYSWKHWFWSWNSNTLATWCEELSPWKRPWRWERLKAGEEADDRGWDGWMASLTQWTWV